MQQIQTRSQVANKQKISSVSVPPLSKSISNVVKQYGSQQAIQHKKSQSQVGSKQQTFLNSLSMIVGAGETAAGAAGSYQTSSPQLPVNNNS